MSAGLGVAVGVATENIFLGIAVGVVFGAPMGAVAAKKKKSGGD